MINLTKYLLEMFPRGTRFLEAFLRMRRWFSSFHYFFFFLTKYGCLSSHLLRKGLDGRDIKAKIDVLIQTTLIDAKTHFIQRTYRNVLAYKEGSAR